MITPVKSYTPRNSPAVKQAIETELEKLERADFIKPSISPYLAPTVCIKKPDGSLRVTIDFRMVNKNVINDAYPMHWVEDQLEAMSRDFGILNFRFDQGILPNEAG